MISKEAMMAAQTYSHLELQQAIVVGLLLA